MLYTIMALAFLVFFCYFYVKLLVLKALSLPPYFRFLCLYCLREINPCAHAQMEYSMCCCILTVCM